MSLLLHIQTLSVSISSSSLLESVDATVVEGQRIGLVGKNGCGKTTLVHLIANDDDMSRSYDEDGGCVPCLKKYWMVTSGKIKGVLSPTNRPPGSVLRVQQDVLQWLLLWPGAAESEEELLEMTLGEAMDAAMMEGLEFAVDDEEAWQRLHGVAKETLLWNLSQYDNTPLGKLSPGSALRAYLAVALHRTDVRLLLLDEPTNHLDLPSILWLQQTILQSGKTVIIVSHDEAFLDAIADHVWEIDADEHQLVVSGAKYSDYMTSKRLAREQQRKAYEEQQKRHEKLSKVANKLKAAAKSGEKFQSKDHDLLQRDFKRDRAGRSGKKAKAVEKFRDSEEKVERVKDHVPLRIRLDPLSVGNDSCIVLDSVELGYKVSGHGDCKVERIDKDIDEDIDDDGQHEFRKRIASTAHRLPLPPVSLRVDFGERVAIIGYNSVGKSTLLRTLLGQVLPFAGTVSVGRELRVGDLMQAHESLPRDISARQHVASVTNMSSFKGGNRLIRYGLTLGQVDQPIGELNPGARARLLLALFSIQKVNALVLDEPTNHMDEEAVYEVIASLNSYKGSIVVVSHDRSFLAALNLTRTLALCSEGLREIESVEAYVEELEEKVHRVVDISFS
eukprot:m.38552 g.38552  ORF g.38552 m.38552 type:complete len:616 (+) comp10223_c0_seq1:252-2099(+)